MHKRLLHTNWLHAEEKMILPISTPIAVIDCVCMQCRANGYLFSWGHDARIFFGSLVKLKNAFSTVPNLFILFSMAISASIQPRARCHGGVELTYSTALGYVSQIYANMYE
jgi:hypothetical protein